MSTRPAPSYRVATRSEGDGLHVVVGDDLPETRGHGAARAKGQGPRRGCEGWGAQTRRHAVTRRHADARTYTLRARSTPTPS